MSTEKEDLDQFVRSNGWLRFKQFAEREWQDQFAKHVRVAVNDADDVAALRKLQQVMVARDAVERLLRWPTERLSEIERTERGHVDPNNLPLSRRGPL